MDQAFSVSTMYKYRLLANVWLCISAGFCSGELVIYGKSLVSGNGLDTTDPHVQIFHRTEPIQVKARVSKFRFLASRLGRLSLQVWRPTGVTNTYRLLGNTSEYTVSSVGIHHARLNSPVNVQQGDVIGVHYFDGAVIPRHIQSISIRNTLRYEGPVVNIGSEIRFYLLHSFRKYAVQAMMQTTYSNQGNTESITKSDLVPMSVRLIDVPSE